MSGNRASSVPVFFEVSEILGKRNIRGETKYLIRWKGYSSKDNTWEPASSLRYCPEMLSAFEKKWEEKMKKRTTKSKKRSQYRKKKTGSVSRKLFDDSESINDKDQESKEESLESGNAPIYANDWIGGVEALSDISITSEGAEDDSMETVVVQGFDRGLEPECILGASSFRDGIMFIMKWKNDNLLDYVPTTEANIKCPQLVIQFYESRLVWCMDDVE